jgi:hypothetical protein
MPQAIDHIDAIARKLQRDVLFVVFHSPRKAMTEGGSDEREAGSRIDWKNCAVRKQLIEWLEIRNIGWRPCGHFADTNTLLAYRGQIYIDLCYDPLDPGYSALAQYLELPDGSMRFPTATFCMLELQVAMTNAEHDEPGFWARWAETF